MRLRLRRIGLAVLVAVSAGGVGAVDRARAEERYVEEVFVTSHDGTKLSGRVVLPHRPANGETFPVVLWNTPYAGTLDPQVDEPFSGGRVPVVPVQMLLEEGYAVVAFHMRGTGSSGGCFDMFGAKEQADQKVLLDWIVSRPWSSDSVAMLGHSSDAIPALWAGVSGHPALKTIVVSGIVTDLYTAVFSPQGAVMDDQMWSAFAPFFGVLAAAPARPFIDPTPTPGEVVQNYVMSGYLGEFESRVCPDLAEDLAVTARDTFARESFSVWRKRSTAWYEERRVLPHLDKVKAAVLLAHGFQDYLAFEEDRVWKALSSAPKWQWEGQWTHGKRPTVTYRHEVLKPWLAHWVKGEGPAPAEMGRVSYEVSPVPWNRPDPPTDKPADGWPTSTSWPPAEATERTLRLTSSGLSDKPSTETLSFVARPDESQRQVSIEARDPDFRNVSYAPPCLEEVSGDSHLLYVSGAVKGESAVIAGNPSVRLVLESSLRAGTFSVQLFDLAPGFRCEEGVPKEYEFLTEGGVDLRFVADRYTATAFPAGQQQVRVDLQSLAEELAPGHRLAVLLSLGPQKARVAQGFFPHITVSGESRLLLPVTKGTIPAAPQR